MFSYFAGPNSAVQALSQHGSLKAIKNNIYVMINVLIKYQILFTVDTTILKCYICYCYANNHIYVKSQIKASISLLNFLHLSL